MLPNLTLYKKGKLTDLEEEEEKKVQNLKKTKNKKLSNNLLEKRRPNLHFSQLGINDNV